MNIDKETAECVGLWLAEGDNRCHGEINFCNNEFTLVRFFHEIMMDLFRAEEFNTRLYVYTPDGKEFDIDLGVDWINWYVDENATKTYYIWRLASVELMKKWRQIVSHCKNDPEHYADVLRGFFAGEGNIKTGAHNNRAIRIAQLKSEFVERMLDHLNITYKYTERGRSYVITHLDNWLKLGQIKVADLHPKKKRRFWKVLESFKEPHYRDGYVKAAAYALLENPQTSRCLAEMINRSQARIYDVLKELKSEGKINNFRIHSKDWWIRNDENCILISDVKKRYLDYLGDSCKRTSEMANYFNVGSNSSHDRLKELEKLGLVERKEDKNWRCKTVNEMVLVI